MCVHLLGPSLQVLINEAEQTNVVIVIYEAPCLLWTAHMYITFYSELNEQLKKLKINALMLQHLCIETNWKALELVLFFFNCKISLSEKMKSFSFSFNLH